jgi:hypothetical protein
LSTTGAIGLTSKQVIFLKNFLVLGRKKMSRKNKLFIYKDKDGNFLVTDKIARPLKEYEQENWKKIKELEPGENCFYLKGSSFTSFVGAVFTDKGSYVEISWHGDLYSVEKISGENIAAKKNLVKKFLADNNISKQELQKILALI